MIFRQQYRKMMRGCQWQTLEQMIKKRENSQFFCKTIHKAEPDFQSGTLELSGKMDQS